MTTRLDIEQRWPALFRMRAEGRSVDHIAAVLSVGKSTVRER